MAWPCSMFAVVAVVFSGCFQTVHSVGEPPSVRTSLKSRCQTPACYALEAAMIEKMNMSADPCEDFSEFACGRFYEEHVIPNGTSRITLFSSLDINNTVIMKEILVNGTIRTQPQYLAKMRRFYLSCLNETQIERVGLTPYFNERAFVDDWPTLNPRWSEAGFDLNEVIARYAGVSIFPIFSVNNAPDLKTTSKYVIHITQPSLGLGHYELLRPRNDALIRAYETYLAETAIALNARRDVAERDARDVVDLEIQLARIQVPLEQQNNVRKQINPVKLNQLYKLYPRLDTERAVRSTFSTVNITLPDDEVVNIDFPTYIKDIEAVLECFPKRTIQNLFGFKYTVPKVRYLTRRLRDIYMYFDKVKSGIQIEQPRWQLCLSWTAYIFPKVLEAITSENGYPDGKLQETDIDRRYENYTMSEDNFYSNRLLGVRLQQLRTLALLKKPIDENTWKHEPFNVTAYVPWPENVIEILVNGTNPTQPQYLVNMRRLYKSCLNETQIELVGLTPYLNDRAFVDDWPTLNPHWSDAGFDLNEVIARYAGVSIFPIFTVSTDIELKNSSRRQIAISQAKLGRRDYQLTGPRNGSYILSYEKYLAEIAIALKADRDVAERDARDVVDLERELSRIQVPQIKQNDIAYHINPVKLSQFSVLYPRLDIARAIRSAYNAVNITLPDDEVVNNYFPAYMKNIESVLECFPKRTIQNLFGFRHAVSKVARLTKRLRDIYLDFDWITSGVITEEPRWQYCVGLTAEIFQQGMNKQFVHRVFSETAKRATLDMISEMKGELRKMINNATWMSDETKDEALKKLVAMKSKIGYPDGDFQEADIDRLYENYNMREDNYYNNKILGLRLEELRNLALLRTPVNNNIWGVRLYRVNAYASPFQNAIVFPAAIMQPPVFSELFPSYVNYAAIGSAIGHEIGHLFDVKGSQFDEKGNLRNWWTKEDRDNFVNRSKCIIDQFNNFYIDEINMTLNGELTQGETEGDTSGLKIAFRAYKQHLLRSVNPEWLPSKDFSPDQVFFLSFAQLYCQKYTKMGLVDQVMVGPHPPGKYRLTGALQNSDDFARVYNCSQGSYMNPKRKCGMW